MTFILTEDKDWSKEYIGVPSPCNLCIVERNLRILNLPLGELLTTPTLLMIEVSITSLVQVLIPGVAGLVCGEKSGVSHAGFYKCCVLSVEVNGLMHLS